MHTAKQLEELEAARLAPYALKSLTSKGRQHDEPADELRTNFQRDKDRIVHAKAFRRLKGKTQVTSPLGDDDHVRDRLTHTMEVAQISRGLARNLNLNEDAAEAIALAHDLGHTPFGHAGEVALDECLREYGFEFEHNQQSKRVVEFLERIYPLFPGLNLSYEILEGLEKHQTPFDQVSAHHVGASLEAQVVNLADEIAYLNHDLDDALRLNFVSAEQLQDIELCAMAMEDIFKELGSSKFSDDQTGFLAEFPQRMVSQVMKIMLSDLLTNSETELNRLMLTSLEDVYNYKEAKIIRFSPQMRQKLNEVRRFLYENFYKSDVVENSNKEGQQIIRELFHQLKSDPQFISSDGELDVLSLSDYIAGMTDKFARDFFKREMGNY